MIRFDDNFRDLDVIGNLTDENANLPGPADGGGRAGGAG